MVWNFKIFKSHNTIAQLFNGDPDIDCRGRTTKILK